MSLPSSFSLDGRAVSIVHGFVRSLRGRLSSIIADEIINLCAAYSMEEHFGICSKMYRVERDRKTIGKRKNGDGSAFGSFAVHSINREVHSWTFEVLQTGMSPMSPMSFGITEFWDHNTKRHCFHASDTRNYCAQHFNKRVSQYIEGEYSFFVCEGMVVRMDLNLKTRMLVFYTNGECWGPAYENIVCAEGLYYKMAVCLSVDCRIRLMKHTIAGAQVDWHLRQWHLKRAQPPFSSTSRLRMPENG